jgi:UDP-2,3-diacylglucosamine pyrophosphatase LpxH
MNHDATIGHGRARRHVRALFVSDVHLGSRYSHPERFLSCLDSYQAEHLYLVGDFIDGWRLSRTWRWPPVYHRIVRRLLSMAGGGTRLYYAPGNHDAFLRHYLCDFGFVDVAEQFVHRALDQRRYLVTHGDRFDRVEQVPRWLARLGSAGYELLMWLNHVVNRLRRLVQLGECRFSVRVKYRLASSAAFIRRFEDQLVQEAMAQCCEGVICGHIHAPALEQSGDVMYYNTGDWVENCTALVEHLDGRWEVVRFSPHDYPGTATSGHGEDLLQYVGRRPRARLARGHHRRPLAAPA